MNSPAPSYHGYRFPAEIIAHDVWLYFRFSLSFRDVEDLLAQRGITVTYETIRKWCRTFGRAYARRLRRRRGQLGAWHLDELFVTLNGRPQLAGALRMFLRPPRQRARSSGGSHPRRSSGRAAMVAVV